MYQGLGSRPFDTGRQRGGWLCVNIRRVCFAPRYRTLTVQRSCGSHSARHRPSMGIQYPRPRVRQIGHSPSQILTPPGLPIIQVQCWAVFSTVSRCIEEGGSIRPFISTKLSWIRRKTRAIRDDPRVYRAKWGLCAPFKTNIFALVLGSKATSPAGSGRG